MSVRMISLAAIAAAAAAGVAVAAPTVQLAQAQTPAPAAQRPAAPPTRAQLSASIDNAFRQADTNKDGVLSRAEIAAIQTRDLQRAATVQRQRAEAAFKRLDTNNNGSLSLAEYLAGLPAPRAAATPEQLLAQLDADKNGSVSAAEYRNLPLSNFDRADTNKDGTLSAQEAQAARARR